MRFRWWHGALLAAAVVPGAYFLNFAPHSGGVSHDPEDWARFGEYIGGAFGFFAFGAVLVTVELQRRQLKQLSEQATVDELMRLCRDLVLNIDGFVARYVRMGEIIGQYLEEGKQPHTMLGVLNLLKDPKPRTVQQRDYISKLAREFAGSIAPEIDQLANCVQDMIIWGGSPVILNYYRHRYRETVEMMQSAGYQVKTAEFWLKYPALPEDKVAQ